MNEEDKIRLIIKESAKEIVRETLEGLGFDINKAHEMQADLYYLRVIRKGSEKTAYFLKTSILGVVIPSVLYLLWEAIKYSITKQR